MLDLNSFAIVPVLLLVVLLSVALEAHRGERTRKMVERWAARCGFHVLSCERSIWSSGPFWLARSKSQTVCRITIRDRNGSVRHGWARCGHWFFGLSKEQVEVRWN